MRVLNILLPSIICFFFLLSCSSNSGRNNLYVNLTDSFEYNLLHPEAIEHDMDMAQYTTAAFGNRNYFFIAWVKADKDAIEMSFFNDIGASMGELSYRDSEVKFSSTVIPRIAMRYIKPEYIVADFQLCFYNPTLLEKALEDSGLVLEIQNGNRRILNGDEVIIEIIKTDNSVSLTNNLRGYTYTMEGDFLAYTGAGKDR